MKALYFFFDFLSPYSYLAWQWLYQEHESLQRAGMHVHLRPVPMAIVIKKFVDKGPGEIPPKRDFLFKVVLSRAQALNIPLACPPKIPFDTYPALRILASLGEHSEQMSFGHKVFSAIWGQGLSLTEDLLSQILTSVVVPSRVHAVEQHSQSREISALIKSFMKQTQEFGVFGVPSFVLAENGGTELFWGHDSIPLLQSAMAGEAWYNQMEYVKFMRALGTPEQHDNL
ncbi:MAG: DsbA family protein [Bdellovibrio sp.]|nr:DsbA family protein [Bdellovibrio sp.]